MPLDVDAIATAAATRLRVDPADVHFAAAAAAAAVAVDVNVDAADLPDPGADPMVDLGVTLLAIRIFQDQGTPSGSLAVLGDSVAAGAVIPEDLTRHLHHYWRHLQHRWGIA
jgi:hypothetical protein